jgi:hypothetical protein
MAVVDPDLFADKDVTPVYIGGRINEPKRVEAALCEQAIAQHRFRASKANAVMVEGLKTALAPRTRVSPQPVRAPRSRTTRNALNPASRRPPAVGPLPAHPRRTRRAPPPIRRPRPDRRQCATSVGRLRSTRPRCSSSSCEQREPHGRCTSASTVMASFRAGAPPGMSKPYYTTGVVWCAIGIAQNPPATSPVPRLGGDSSAGKGISISKS